MQPGQYTVKITAGSLSQSQPFEIIMDPRVKGVSAADLRKQFELAAALYLTDAERRELKGMHT